MRFIGLLMISMAVVTIGGCKGLPEYSVSRGISAVDYAAELIQLSAQPNRKPQYEIQSGVVRSLQSGSLIAMNYPLIIGRRMASYCTVTGGELISPKNRPAEVRGDGFESVRYGCKKKDGGGFAFAVTNISSRPNALTFDYNMTVYESDVHAVDKLREYAKWLDVEGF